MRGSLATAWIVGVMLAVVLIGAGNAHADGVPQFLNVQGVLYDNDANPVNDVYDLTVSLYRDAGGTLLAFQQTFADVTVENGIFHVELTIPTASGNPFVLYPALWLGVAVDADAEMTPRQRLTSVGYAMEAKHADEATKARDVFCDGDGDPLTNDPVPCVSRGELEQTYALGDADQEALSAVSLSTKCVGCVDSVRIANGTIATVDLGDGTVTTAKIANGTLLSEDIGDGQVLSIDIANGTILSEDIGDGEVRTLNILNGTILTEDLANLAVSNAKLGSDAVTTDKIQNGQVMTVDLADKAVIHEKLGDGAVLNDNIGEVIHQNNLPVAGKLSTERGTVIVGDYLTVNPSGVVSVDMNGLNVDIDAGLPVGQNLVQWEDVKWKNKADKSANWKNDTCTSGSGTCTVSAIHDVPYHGGYGIQFLGTGAWLYARDMVEVAPDREYYGTLHALNRTSSTVPSFLAGVRAFDKEGAQLSDVWFMAPSDGNPQLAPGVDKKFSGILYAGDLPVGAAYVQPILGMTNSNGQIYVDAVELAELTTANDVACTGCVQSADIANGTIATVNLADGAVTSAKILDGGILSADIGAGEVKTANIADSAVQTAQLAAGAVTNDKIGAGQVTGLNLKDGDVGTNDLGLGVVTTDKIADGGVQTADLANGHVTSEKIQNGTVTTVDLAADAVTAAILAPDAVDTAAIQNQAVTGGKIADDAVGAQHIGAGQVTTDELLNGTIKAEDLSSELAWIGGGDITVPNNKSLIFADDETNPATADAAWITEATTGESDNLEIRMILGFEEDDSEKFSIYRYSDGAGTTKTKEHEFTAAGNAYHKGILTVGNSATFGGDITSTGGHVSGILECPAGGCIDSNEIENGTIVNEDIAVGAGITPTKIQGEALTKTSTFGGEVGGLWNNLVIGSNTITSGKIVDGAVGNNDLSSTAVTTDKIVDGTILGSDLANNTVTDLQINTGAVKSDEIYDGTITAADLGNDSVGSAHIQNSAVGSSEIQDGQVMAADIGANQIDGSKIVGTSWGSSGVSIKFARDDHQHDADYVNVSGDTMTGDLTVAHSGATAVTVRSTNGGTATLNLNSTGVDTDAALQLSAVDTVKLTGANLVLDANKGVTAYGLTLTGTTGALACTDCVDSTDIQNGTITTADIVGTGLAATAITGEALTKATAHSGEVTGTWNSLIVANNVIDVDNLKTDSVDATKIVNGTILTDDIQNRTIQAVDLANDTITGNEIANNAISSAELAANAVYTNAIQNGAVTASKLASDSVSASNIVNDSITTSDIQDYTITASDLSNNFWSTLDTNYVVKDGRQILFEDSDDSDRAAYFKEFSSAGALDLGLVLGYNNADLADQTFTIYSSDAANNKVTRHVFRADGTSEHRGDTYVGDSTAGVEFTAGELARIPTYATTRSDLVVSGAIIHPKDTSAGGTVLSVADAFEIRGDFSSAPTHGYLGADAANLVLAAGNKGNGTLYLNRKDNTTAGTVITGGNLQVGGSLTCTSSSGDCVSGSVISNGTITTDDILNGTVGTVDIASNAITSAQLAANAVYTNAIQDGVVTSAKILDRTIQAVDVGNDQLTANEIGASAIGASELADNAVDTNAIVDANVTQVKLAADSVNSAKIVDGSIVSADIADGTIQNADMQAGSATTGLTLDKFKDSDKPVAPGGTIAVWKTGTGTGTGNALFFEDDTDASHQDATDPYLREISDGATADTHVRLVLPDGTGTEQFSIGVNTTEGTYKHKFDSAGNAEITAALTVGGALNVAGNVNANGNIVTMNGAKYALYASGTTLNVNYNGTSAPYATTYIGGAVSMGGLTATSLSCPNCVNSATIADGTVGTADLVDGGVGTVDLAANAVNNSKIADGEVLAADLAANSVNNSKIVDGEVYSAEIADGTIANADVSATAGITYGKIATGALTGGMTWQGAVTGAFDVTNNKLTTTLAADSVSSAHIANGSVANVDLAGDAVTSDKILNGTITTADLSFTIVGAGQDIAVSHGKKLSFETSDTVGSNENGEVAYFQETTSGSDNDAELGLFLANNNGAANKERLVIYKTDGTTPTAQHWFYSDGMAKHAGDLYTLGTLYATTNAQAPIFRDANNPNNYYADPASTSVFNHVQAVRYRDPDDAAGTTYFLDLSSTSQVNDFQARTFKDLDAPGSYWVDMNNTSQLNDVRANIFRDLANPNNYYVDPAGSSRLATTATDNSYTYGWFRNYNAGTGLYNEATGRHFYSQDANYWRQSSNVGTVYYDGANSTVRGYVYHDGTNIGFLPPDGNWQIRAWNSGVELYDTTYMATAHANILYDRDNPNNFYVDPTGTSRMVHGNFNYITTGSANDYNHFYSWTTLHGAYGLYSPEVNGAHFYPNNGTYGAWRIVGSRNSWYGLEFDTAAGQTSLMMGTTGQGWGSQQIGMHNNSQGWLWRFDHRTLNADGMNDFGGGNIDPSGTSSLADVNASCVARASCPSGWLQAGDTCISGNRGTGPWRNAVHDCATAYSAHLCSFAEYVAGRANGQITDSAWFWTADIQTSIPGMGSGTGSHLYPTIFNPGGYNPYNSADGFTYTDGWEWNYRYWRCCLKK